MTGRASLGKAARLRVVCEQARIQKQLPVRQTRKYRQLRPRLFKLCGGKVCRSPFVDLLRRQDVFAAIQQLHEIHTFREIGYGITFPFLVFKFPDFFSDQAKNGDMRDDVVVVLNGDKLGGRIGENREVRRFSSLLRVCSKTTEHESE
jgi:hypothetical protein